MKKMITFLALFASLSTFGQILPTDVTLSFPLNGDATELSAGSYTGTIIGGVTATTDRFGNASGAVQLNGTDGYIDIPYSTSVGTADFSISYWACPNTGNAGIVFSKETTNNPTNQFRMGGTGTYSADFSNGDNTVGGNLANTPTENVWAFYTITRAGGVMTLYVNGVQQSTFTTAQTINHSNTENYRIGATYNCSSFYNGKIDDLKMFQHALTPVEINTIYNYAENALAFDGVDDYVTLPTLPTTTDFSNGFSYTGWVKWNTFNNNYSRLLDIGNGENSDNIVIANFGTNNRLVIHSIVGFSNLEIHTNAILTAGQWVHVGATIGNTGLANIYINGDLVTSGQINIPQNIERTKNYLGKSNWNSDPNFDGSMDEVSIWSKELSPAEITTAMNTGFNGTEVNLVAYYTFNQGVPAGTNTGLTTLANVSGSANTGTLSGFALSGATSNWVDGIAPTISTPAVVSTQAVSAIGATTATGNGNITDLGAPGATQYGVVWSSSSNPTVELSTKTELGVPAAIGAFSSAISGLAGSTTYYVKAYATNSIGSSYGIEESFTTLEAITTATTACTAGQLATLGSDYLSTITNLKLTGTIDARDVKTMRDLMPNLEVLNLGDATISAYSGTEGTIPFERDYYANQLPTCSFLDTISWNAKMTLTTITLPVGLVSIGNYAFYNCTGLTSSWNLPSGVTSIGEYAFYNCAGLSGSLNLPSGIISIEADAFGYCSGITSLTLPEGFLNIPTGTFYGCSGLTSLTLPSTVDYLGDFAFSGCTSLKTIYSKNATPPSVGEYCFDDAGVNAVTDVYVPTDAAVAEYKADVNDAPRWYLFFPGDIIKTDFGTSTAKATKKDVSVHTLQKTILVEGTQVGETVSVYTVTGMVVKIICSTGELLTLPMDIPGVYVVKTAGKTVKVIL